MHSDHVISQINPLTYHWLVAPSKFRRTAWLQHVFVLLFQRCMVYKHQCPNRQEIMLAFPDSNPDMSWTAKGGNGSKV